MRGTVAKSLRKKAKEESKGSLVPNIQKRYDELKKKHKNKSNPLIKLEPKNTVQIRWNPITLRHYRKKRTLESFKGVKSVMKALDIVAKRNKEYIVDAVWYNSHRKPINLLTPEFLQEQLTAAIVKQISKTEKEMKENAATTESKSKD